MSSEENEISEIMEKEKLIETVQLAIGLGDRHIPKFYREFLAYKMIYVMDAGTVDKLVKVYDEYEGILIDEYRHANKKQVKDVEKREEIKEKICTFMGKSGIIPKAYCIFRAREFAYALDLNNCEQMNTSLEECADLFAEEYKEKYLVQNEKHKARSLVLNFVNKLNRKG